MYKKLVLFFLSLVSFCLLTPISSAFAADQVQVSLPSFTVTLNGQTIGNDYSKYPLIVYKNITYFPMTYYDCRLLGLKTDWTNDTGLVIEKDEDCFYEYMREINDNKNANKQIAKITADKITVNGNVIDNSTEEYPLLVFRNVTYFPLTWRFAVNEFDWNYTFDQKNGLVIQNNNVKLENPEEWEFRDGGGGGPLGRGDGFWVKINSLYNTHQYSEDTVKKTMSLHEIAQNRETFSKYVKGEKLSLQELIEINNLTGGTTLSDTEIQRINELVDVTRVDVDISNMMPITRNFIDGRMEYQIHKKVGNSYELAYRYLLPSLNGEIPYTGWAGYTFVTHFWLQSNLSTGKYRVSIQHPDYFNYYGTMNNEIQQYILHGPFSGDDEALFDEYEFQVIN